MSSRVEIARELIARYNAQDADAYVELMTEGACEAGYRDAVLREGKEGVRSGLKAMFAQFPQNRAEILGSWQIGDTAMLHERVWRAPDAQPFDVMAIYSFADDLVDRVEFIR